MATLRATMRFPLPALALLLLVLPVPAAEAQAPAPAIVLTLQPGGGFAAEPPGNVTEVAAEAGQRYAWRIHLTAGSVVEVRLNGALDIARALQAVPTLDGRYFVEKPLAEVEAAGARAFNVTGAGANASLVLNLGRGPGKLLNLTRDVAPPVPALGQPSEVTHRGFLLVTRTDERALAELRIKPASGGEEVLHPTPQPAFEQTFPVQGLDPNTAYEVRIRFTDWSGNEAWSAPFGVRTLPRPPAPLPVFRDLFPPPNATMAPPMDTIMARVDSPEANLTRDGIRVFVDLTETRLFTFEGGLVRHVTAQPLAGGLHRASIEATNDAGGKATAVWSFTVAGSALPGPEALPLVAMAVLVAVAMRRR